MHKIIDEWKVGVRDLIILTLSEKIPAEHHSKVRIRGKDYAMYRTNFGGDAEEERTIAVQTTDVGFIGKDVEFV